MSDRNGQEITLAQVCTVIPVVFLVEGDFGGVGGTLGGGGCLQFRFHVAGTSHVYMMFHFFLTTVGIIKRK